MLKMLKINIKRSSTRLFCSQIRELQPTISGLKLGQNLQQDTDSFGGHIEWWQISL